MKKTSDPSKRFLAEIWKIMKEICTIMTMPDAVAREEGGGKGVAGEGGVGRMRWRMEHGSREIGGKKMRA